MRGQGPITAARKINWRINNADWHTYKTVVGRRLQHLTTALDDPNDTYTTQQIVDRRWEQVRDAIIDVAHQVVGIKNHHESKHDRWWSYPVINMQATYNKLRATVRRTRKRNCTQHDIQLRRPARREWINAVRAAWRGRCDAIEQNPRILSWKHLRQTLPSSPQPSLSNFCDVNGAIPQSPHDSLNNFAISLDKAATPPIPSIISPQTERKVARLYKNIHTLLMTVSDGHFLSKKSRHSATPSICAKHTALIIFIRHLFDTAATFCTVRFINSHTRIRTRSCHSSGQSRWSYQSTRKQATPLTQNPIVQSRSRAVSYAQWNISSKPNSFNTSHRNYMIVSMAFVRSIPHTMLFTKSPNIFTQRPNARRRQHRWLFSI